MELVEVTKTFGKTVAVNNLSLDVKPGEFMTLLGPSGCGKTTTLRCIAGYIKPDKGSIYIKGELVNDRPPYERNTGMVFQNYALFPHMSVYENVAFGLKMRKTDKNGIKKLVESSLELIQLPGYEDKYPRQMSGGQQQRVALARALVIRPDVLLLDEPLSNLDLKLRMQMRLELKQIQKKVGITTIYVTHDQGEALIMSDRLAVMGKGSIRQLGNPTEIYECPQNKFVADFIGETNFFEGKIAAINESEVTLCTNDGLTLFASTEDISHWESLKKNVKATASIRPERIIVSKGNQPSLENAFKGNVEAVEYLGSLIKYHIRLDNGHRIVADVQNIEAVGATGFHSVGEEVYISWKPENCLIIPASA